MKRKIIHTLSNSGTGGGQIHLLELLKNTDRSKFDVQIICNNKGHYLHAFHKYADKVHEINFDQSPLFVVRAIVSILRTEKPDVLHNHLLRSCFLGSIAGVITGTRCINNLHGDIQDDQNQGNLKKALYNKFNSRLSRWGTSFICVSEFNKERLVAKGVKADKISVIYNGVKEPPPFDKTSAETINVLCVARLHPAKGIDTILKAAPLLSDNIVVHIVGDGPLELEYKDYIRDQHLQNIKLHGFIPDVTPFLRAADMFLLSSNWEGLPIAIVEAMSFKLPVIATNVGGIAEIVHHHKGGRLFNPHDSKALALIINELSSDLKICREYGEYNYQFYSQHLTLSNMIALTEKMYNF